MKTPPVDNRLKAIASSLSPRQSYRGGFSLVEVMLAMGVLTFAILPVVGLMSVGMNVSQDSIKSATTAQILQQVSLLVQNGESAPFYFSAEAERVTAPELARYGVTIQSTSITDDATKGLALKKLDKVVINRTDAKDVEYSRSFTLSSINPAATWK